jgi:molybdenum cofactor cytidylyltransferase
MHPRPAIVVPAAGPGKRFGGPANKLEQAFEGDTLLGATLRHAIETQLPLVLVTTAPLAALAARYLAARDIVVLSAGEAARGMGAAIAAGVNERSDAAGWLVLPADMPLVRPGSILAVAEALGHHAVAYAQHRGQRGYPVGFAAELFSEIIQLSGDDAARRLMWRYAAQGVDLDDRGVLLDVDTPADLQALHPAVGSAPVSDL